MSSHHFVKEGQEPALFLIDPSSLAQLEPLLEWAPLVIVLDTCLDLVLSWGIKVDVVLAETSQIELIKEKVMEQFPVNVLPYQSGEEPLSTGLHMLRGQQKAVHIISAITEKVFMAAEAFTETMNIALLDNEIKWSFIASGEFEKWVPAHTKLSLRKKMTNDQPFYLQGLIAVAENTVESSADGQVTIKSPSSFWVGETLA